MTNDEAIRYLSILHLGHSLQVKTACEMGIKALQRDKPNGDSHWVLQTDADKPHFGLFICSTCGGWSDKETDFCPNCGSDLRNR